MTKETEEHQVCIVHHPAGARLVPCYLLLEDPRLIKIAGPFTVSYPCVLAVRYFLMWVALDTQLMEVTNETSRKPNNDAYKLLSGFSEAVKAIRNTRASEIHAVATSPAEKQLVQAALDVSCRG